MHILLLGYSYKQAAGKKFQMSTVTDVNYNTIFVAPTPSDSIREAHIFLRLLQICAQFVIEII